MLRTYGTGPPRPMSLGGTTCHIVNPEPAYERGLCGIPIVDIIGEYNAVPQGWILCEGCYVEAGQHRAPSVSALEVLDGVEQLLKQDLPRARKFQYGTDLDERGFYPDDDDR